MRGLGRSLYRNVNTPNKRIHKVMDSASLCVHMSVSVSEAETVIALVPSAPKEPNRWSG